MPERKKGVDPKVAQARLKADEDLNRYKRRVREGAKKRKQTWKGEF